LAPCVLIAVVAGIQPVKEGIVMTKRFMMAVGAGAVALAIAFHGTSVLAKCPKDCKAEFVTAHKACKETCKGLTDKSAKKDCRKACTQTFKGDKSKCKAATNPVAPQCSPSAAFVD